MENVSAGSGRGADAASDAGIRDLLHLFIAWLFGFAYFAILTASLGDGDTGWHLAAGEWILEHRIVPNTDPFSYTFGGKPWLAHEWLSEVVMYAVYSRAGWAGLMLMFGALFGGVLAIVALHFRRWLKFPTALIPTAICFAGLIYHGLARPHLFGWLFLAIWLSNLLRARERDRTPALWSALTLAIWANFHSSFVLGLALIAPVALEALLDAKVADRSRVFVQWTIFGLCCLVATMLTPHGVKGPLLPFSVAGMTNLQFIAEWKPTSFERVSPFEAVLFAWIGYCLYKPVKVPFVRLAVVLGFLYLALAHTRHQAVFVIVTCFLIARPLAEAVRSRAEPQYKTPLVRLSPNQAAPLAMAMALLILMVSALSFSFGRERPDSFGVPNTAVAHVPRELRGRPVFNLYSFGGTLILNNIRPYIDGRSEMYGDRFVEDYVAISKGDIGKWKAEQRKWGIEWTILPPDNKLALYLDRQPEWKRIYADKWAVIHVLKSVPLSAPKAGQGAAAPLGQ